MKSYITSDDRCMFVEDHAQCLQMHSEWYPMGNIRTQEQIARRSSNLMDGLNNEYVTRHDS